jgi:hypothetical protein
MRQITHTYTGNIKYYKFCHTNLFHDGKENTVEPGMDLPPYQIMLDPSLTVEPLKLPLGNKKHSS